MVIKEEMHIQLVVNPKRALFTTKGSRIASVVDLNGVNNCLVVTSVRIKLRARIVPPFELPQKQNTLAAIRLIPTNDQSILLLISFSSMYYIKSFWKGIKQ